MENFDNNEPIINERPTTVSVGKPLLVWLALVLVPVLGFSAYWYYDTYITAATPEVSVLDNEAFEQAATEAAELIDRDDTAAITQAETLVANATNPTAEGRAKLVLGLAQLRVNNADAIRTFKDISGNENYHPFTRSRAVWHAVHLAVATADTRLAENVLFTGEIWGQFLPDTESEAPLRQASIAALTYSMELYPTPQAAAQLAALNAHALVANETTTDNDLTLILSQIDVAKVLLTTAASEETAFYGNSLPLVQATTYGLIAEAQDTINVRTERVTDEQIEANYRAALAVTEEYDLETLYEPQARYQLADYLARLDVNASESEIIALLGPMPSYSPRTYLFYNFQNRFGENNLVAAAGAADTPNQPETILLLANVSPAFNLVLQNLGLIEAT